MPAPLAIRSVATAPAPSKSNAPTPTSSSSELEHGIASVRWAWTFLWDQADPALRFRVGTTFALMIGSKLIAIQVPFLFKHAVDGLSDPQLTMALTPATLLLLYGATRATAEGVGQMRNALFASVTEGSLRRMARSTFTHLHALELGFHLSRRTGALTRTVERGTRALGTLLSTTVLQVLPLAFEVTAVSALLAIKCGPSFSVITLVTLTAYSAFTFAVTRARTKVRKAQNAADSEAMQHFTDSMLNYETVKYFDATAHEARRYDAALSKYEQAAITTQVTLAGLNFGQAAIFSAGLGLSMMLAAQECAAGRMSVGDLVMVQGLIFQLTVPLQILGTLYTSVRQAATDMQALQELLLQAPKIRSREDAPPLVLPRGGHLAFENVHFGYGRLQDGAPLLRGISFEVAPGQTVAIVGGSGSGKTSILRLLYRFYDPHAGRVLVDGQDLRDLDLDSLRRHIGVVPQDVVLFNDTIEYNLRYGRLDASNEEVIRASQQAQLHEAILRMPHGYQTVVGERGLKLSGGEKQRIAIGRALLRDAPILLCDEATSSVDTVTESYIFAQLKALSRRPGRRQTCIMIAHRLSTVVDADCILVVRDGTVVERGTHAELLAESGEYARLWAMQDRGEDEQAGNPRLSL